MRTFSALACALMAVGIGIAAPAAASDNKIAFDTPPADALPVVVDPSHGTGHTYLVPDMAVASVACERMV